ncbi:hypothetical protein HOLleu_23119 [Holothuria leucospilota]|uniref:DUF7041 domain-containing protein n=1 Tax=Holothuria leucospilota TaxID=206669 RepID=A0A9Q1BUQ1_HOLLE|nr:hypothetical protein HOLleu_23119 [Holothuria leucospilota]
MSKDDAATADTKPDDKSLAALALKLPPFWPKDPTLWFAQVEAQFETRGITSQSTKYAYVVASLSPEFAQEIRELLINPPQQHPYDTIKQELIKRTSESEQKRLQKLLISEELGDKKPSQLLRRMKQLLGDSTIEDNILRQLFLQRMPQNVQLILASTADTINLEELALIADRIIEQSNVPMVAGTTHAPPPPTPSGATSGLEHRLSTLEAQLSALVNQLQATNIGQSQRRGRPRSKRGGYGRGRFRNRSRSRSPYREDCGLCFYHWRYGLNAHGRQTKEPVTYDDGSVWQE